MAARAWPLAVTKRRLRAKQHNHPEPACLEVWFRFPYFYGFLYL